MEICLMVQGLWSAGWGRTHSGIAPGVAACPLASGLSTQTQHLGPCSREYTNETVVHQFFFVLIPDGSLEEPLKLGASASRWGFENVQ